MSCRKREAVEEDPVSSRQGNVVIQLVISMLQKAGPKAVGREYLWKVDPFGEGGESREIFLSFVPVTMDIDRR